MFSSLWIFFLFDSLVKRFQSYYYISNYVSDMCIIIFKIKNNLILICHPSLKLLSILKVIIQCKAQKQPGLFDVYVITVLMNWDTYSW